MAGRRTPRRRDELVRFLRAERVKRAHRRVFDADASATARKAETGHMGAGAAALTLGALGVVFGDIGTSPLYSMHEVFDGSHPIRASQAHIYGVLSLIIWALAIIVTLKYVVLIMRADNHGEGGIMALIALVTHAVRSPSGRYLLICAGVFGASLFYGDGMITPAISVLSAVEGLQVASPSLADYVIPIAVGVLTGLFCIQRFGTGSVGKLFGPVMAAWFTVLGILGLSEILDGPSILRCVSPTYAATFIADSPHTAFVALGSVVLAVTGAEALYADMGHFGRPAISRAWLWLIFPCLILNYLGQGALLVSDPSAIDNPFYRLVPTWGQLPMVILATVATVIASQSVIAGAFSVTRQAVQLGFLPRILIRHTSKTEEGQIYVPFVNWVLYACIMGLVVGFQNSTNLAAAYGIAVTGTLAIDTLLAFVVFRLVWRKPLWMVLLGGGAFLLVDLSFFAANLPKIPHGGWFPLLIGAISYTLLMTWRKGRELLAERMRIDRTPLRRYLIGVIEEEPARVPGTAVFLTAGDDRVPLALMHNVQHNHILHRHNVLVTVRTHGVPEIAERDRLDFEPKGFGFVRMTVNLGFQEQADVPMLLGRAAAAGRLGDDVDVEHASYFLNHVELHTSRGGGMAVWRKRLFRLLHKNSVSAARQFNLPPSQVVELGGLFTI